MMLYLMQHAQAVAEEVDALRPLSEEGRTAAARVAAHVALRSLPVDHIYHSGKLRARQTAEILGATLHVEDRVEQLEGLNPKDRAAPLARWLQGETQKSAESGIV